ncbi:MAG: hypothetical protein ACU83V_03015 [Gammaproteobacteria bacterium]
MYNNVLKKRLKSAIKACTFAVFGLGIALNIPTVHSASKKDFPGQIKWVNHFDLLPGDDDLITSHKSTSSGVGGGLTGLVITSTTPGENFAGGGNKVVHMALELPKQTKINGVRVCYEYSTNSSSVISQIRLAQVQNPPSSAVVMLDDGTDQTDPGPVCVNSTLVKPAIKAIDGPIILSLRINSGANFATDKIVIRGLGILVK